MSSWSPETIIALVTLIATAPSSLLVFYDFYLRHYGRRHSSPQLHHIDSVPNLSRSVNSSTQHVAPSDLITHLPTDAQFYYFRDIDVQMHIRQLDAHVERS
ncbi:uncharacterized protein BO72DRAFT_446259 [Aspergillus fijiensis CBS 313.89]|uniref:Uncharacterized protein n=1 Tax=Aspergillus fijiensis CBS 313.89 TaxID=1448319 RepID=A0A8G1RX80_9EURO|nr:uncharacterized protein BO72DRAFT_446259 [Aspergillus fijiensis CBS 313.89]RAK79450.1 hypothetical protein BO72DRAFT_446259 [Aspergillus fijiensis CBS 313.89]